MQISEIRLHPIAIADAPLRSSYGRHAPYALRTIVELKTTDGITGISETYGGDGPLSALEAAKENMLGRDPFALARLRQELNEKFAASASAAAVAGGRTQTWLVPGENPLDVPTRTYAAYEVACLDIIGKAAGKPVCDVVGGGVRDLVPFSAYLFYKHGGGGGLGEDAREDEYGECLDPESIVRQCKEFIRKYGFKEIKLKGGVLDPDAEIETIRALRREFGPAYPLRIDPNCAWSVETSMHVGRSLKEELSDGGYLEDPCAGIDGMAEVRRRLREEEGIDMVMASNVATTTFEHVVEAKRTDGVQVILSDPHYWGGVRAIQRLSDLCETLGLGVSMHSNNHLGVSLMTMAHVAAAAPAITYACDTHYPWQTEQDEVIVGGRVKFEEGCVRIPDKPGLGVELNYDQVERCNRIYEKLGYRKRDDVAEMRKHVDPNWERILPRW